jgi:hypothetical protein
MIVEYICDICHSEAQGLADTSNYQASVQPCAVSQQELGCGIAWHSSIGNTSQDHQG